MTVERVKQTPFRVFAIIAVLVIALFVTAWIVLFGLPKGRVRPSGVPSDAEWVGGADGGVYIRCIADITKNVDHCELWDDYTGEGVSADYQVRGQARAAKERELNGKKSPDYIGHIYLANGIVLDRVQPPITVH